jgi:CRISPR-associated exonuclease Cas4
LESVWDENVFTLRGQAVHERADEPTTRAERGRRIERALPVWSDRYGLTGRADIVEFTPDGRPVPVEYKSGKRREPKHAAVQLCAQALCLEEMFGVDVPEGALFFAASQTRETIAIGAALRERTMTIVDAIRTMLDGYHLPPARFDRRCGECSLLDACLPHAVMRAAANRATQLYIPREERELP